MYTNDDLLAAEQRWQETSQALRHVREARDEAERVALAAVRAEHDPAIRVAAKAEYAAREELQAIHAAIRRAKSSAHPWLGKRVYRVDRRKREEGIVEIFERGDAYPEHHSDWRRPEPGTLIVRRLLKDGGTGIKASVLSDAFPGWRLVEDAQ